MSNTEKELKLVDEILADLNKSYEALTEEEKCGKRGEYSRKAIENMELAKEAILALDK